MKLYECESYLHVRTRQQSASTAGQSSLPPTKRCILEKDLRTLLCIAHLPNNFQHNDIHNNAYIIKKTISIPWTNGRASSNPVLLQLLGKWLPIHRGWTRHIVEMAKILVFLLLQSCLIWSCHWLISAVAVGASTMCSEHSRT